MTERLDDVAASLFRAARQERPSSEAKRRVLELAAKPGRQSRRRVLQATTAVFALAAGIAVFVTLSKPTNDQPLSLRPEPTRPTEAVREPLPSAPPASAPAPAPIAPVLTARNPAPPPSSSATRPRLADEVRALEAARTEIRAGKPDAALRMLDDYAHNLRGGVMTAEATLLRIEALSRAGRASEADALARRFVAANPHSSLSDRARGLFSHDSDAHERNVDAGETP